MHTTDTQKLIVKTALSMSGAPVHTDAGDRLVEQVAQAMLMIERAGLQSYMLTGFNWSCAARGADDPEVQRSEETLAQAADQLGYWVHRAPGSAGRKIRANRARRLRAKGLEEDNFRWEDQPFWRALQDRREARRLGDAYGFHDVVA